MEAMSFDDYKQEVREDAEAYIDRHAAEYGYFNDLMNDMMEDGTVTGGSTGKLGATTAQEAIATLANDKNFMEKQFPYMMDHEIAFDAIPPVVDSEIRRFFLKIQWCTLRDYFEAKKG